MHSKKQEKSFEWYKKFYELCPIQIKEYYGKQTDKNIEINFEGLEEQ